LLKKPGNGKENIMRKFIMTAALIAFASPALAEEYTVRMITDMDNLLYYFEPAALTIKSGDTVKWVNMQEDFHNAVTDAVPEGAEFFESPMMEKEGESWSYTFTKSGTYSYHCHPHAAVGMQGWIVVDYTSAPDEIQKTGGAHDHNHGDGDGSSSTEQENHDDHDHGQ
jgi:plastocyanin